MPIFDAKTQLKIIDILYSLVGKEKVISHKVVSDLQIIKDDATGYKWLAVYSNSFRDEDNTPEIISSKSQKAFVKNVDAGNYDYPELQLWHNPKWKFGVATVVAYDEVEPGIGFAIAGGTIDVGKEYVADALLESGIVWKMSHGMPTGRIIREFTDSTVYAKHVTTEITVLPAQFAANPLTGFGLIGDDTMISDKKKAELVGDLGIDMDVLTRLEASNKEVALAEKNTREFKEIDNVDKKTKVVEEAVEQVEDTTGTISTTVVVEDVVENTTEEIVDQVQDKPASSELDIQNILDGYKDASDAVVVDIAEIKSALDIVVDAIKTLSVAQKDAIKRIDAVEKDKDDKVIAQTPTYSATFKDRIESVIGNKDAKLDKEKDVKLSGGPAEAKKKNVEKQFGSEYLGSLVANSQ